MAIYIIYNGLNLYVVFIGTVLQDAQSAINDLTGMLCVCHCFPWRFCIFTVAVLTLSIQANGLEIDK